MDDAERILKDVFKLESFRLQQKKVIERLLGGENALVLFPTGGKETAVLF